MDKYYMPRYLNERYKIASLTLDEVAAVVIPTLASIYFSGGPMIGIITGIVLILSLKKIKGKQGHNQFLRVVYWHLPQIIRYRSTPPSYVREILG